MKTLSVKNLKKTTRSLYKFNGTANQSGETTTTGGSDPTITTITVLTTTH